MAMWSTKLAVRPGSRTEMLGGGMAEAGLARIETLKALRGGGEIGGGGGVPLPSRLRGLGSVVSSPSGVRGRAPAKNNFSVF